MLSSNEFGIVGSRLNTAFSPLTSINENVDDTRTSYYNVLSGTSMSCLHDSAAAAAYVKSFHPDWSPAIIFDDYREYVCDGSKGDEDGGTSGGGNGGIGKPERSTMERSEHSTSPGCSTRRPLPVICASGSQFPAIVKMIGAAEVNNWNFSGLKHDDR
nr:subtilisin-like protease SBT4.15 [Ipomoea batatas]